MFSFHGNLNNSALCPRICLSKLFATAKVLKHETAVQGKDYIFFKPEVQSLLKKLTQMDVNKVFRRRALGEKLEPPSYRFMTTAQIQEVMKETVRKANEKLQMPPVVPVTEHKERIISSDPELSGFDEAKFVFTDITFDVKNRERSIVVREPDGTLRAANSDERHRSNQIYFPIPGRTVFHPRMFKPENLKPILERKDYEFILDRACVQFEVDSIEYHNIVSSTYDHVDETRSYELLRSTRHYGPFLLHLTKKKEIDNLMVENLHSDRLEDACWLIMLYHLVNPDSKSAGVKLTEGKESEYIQAYIDNDSPKKSYVQAALDSYCDVRKIDSV